LQVLGIKFNSLSQNRQLKVNSENRNQNEVSNYQSYSYPSFGRYDLVSNTIKNSLDEMSKFPKDIEYRKNLMKNSGLNPEEYYKLRSIIGSEEIESIMKEFNDSEEFYSSGIDYNNVKNHKMRANLHMHTVDSDGTLTPDVLLDKASEYADDVVKNNPSAKNAPFVIAVTDHDTTGSAKELIKKVASNPEKYKNLRIILGVEMTTYNNVALDITKAPVNTHVLVYGIDPNEPTFDNFINSTKDKKLLIEKMMIDKTNKIYEQEYGKKDFFSLEESHNYFQPLKKNILGIYNYMAIYINTKYNLENVVLKDEKLKNLLEKNNLPTKTEDLLKDIQDFYYPLTHNNKPIKAKEAILSYLVRFDLISDNCSMPK